MSLANTFWLVGLTLEILCFRRLVSHAPKLAGFVAWQLVLDIAALFLGKLTIWGTLYWLGHSFTYVLLLFVFMPVRVRSLPGLYWLISLSLTVFFTTNVWLYEPWKQFSLAVFCGALALFAALVSYITHSHWLPKATWLGVMLWASGQVV